MSAVKRLNLSKSQSKAAGPAFSSGRRLTNMSNSISTTDRRFGGKSGTQSISGPKLGRKK